MMILLWTALACSKNTSLQDANNYDFTSTISSQSLAVASRTDLVVDWTGLTQDLQGRAMDPATEIDIFTIAILALNQEDTLAALADDDLRQSDITAYATLNPEEGVTTAMLSDFDFLGNRVIPDIDVTAGRGTWLLSASTTGVPGARMLMFFDPVDGGPEVPIALSSDSASLAYDVELEALEEVSLDGALVEWSDLTVDMRGLPIRLSDIDRLDLGWYAEDLTGLEADFLGLEDLVDDLYTTPLNATIDQDLSVLTNSAGETFGGVTNEGTWLLALRCMACSNPAPPFLTVLR
jgi:hypothetical protein